MMLSDMRDYVDSLQIADKVYMGKLDNKQEKSIGVYNSNHTQAYGTAIGGPELESYGTKYVTILVHWNHSPRDTEKAALELFEILRRVDEVTINNETIKFMQPLIDGPVDVGTDDAGICEMVIELAVIYERKGV